MIEIDEELCDGCADCVSSCAEGAIEIVEGKARVVREEFCDGLGACVPACHAGALRVVSKDVADFDETAVREHLARTGRREAVRPMEAPFSGLTHWPVQLHLVQPGAPFFRNRELVILATCSPVASAEIHRRFIRGRAVVVACPKLDHTAPYAEKLAAILREPSIPKAVVVIMEVPCCKGLTRIAREAAGRSGRGDLAVEEAVVDLRGRLKSPGPERS